jgi:hypothetical protein
MIWFPFLCFGFMAVALGHPEKQTVSHFFPKLCAALQRKFVADAACPPAGALFSAYSVEKESLPLARSWVLLW